MFIVGMSQINNFSDEFPIDDFKMVLSPIKASLGECVF